MVNIASTEQCTFKMMSYFMLLIMVSAIGAEVQTKSAEVRMLLIQGAPSIPRNKLPLVKYRPRGGHLSCSSIAHVPDKTVLDLKYPVHLGTLSLPLLVGICHPQLASANMPNVH